jgi:hypothetical protein
MKGINILLAVMYVLTGVLFTIGVLEEVTNIDLGIGRLIKEEFIINSMLVIFPISGIFAYVRSYRAALIKLILPVVMTLLFWILSIRSFCTDECYIQILAMMATYATVGYALLLLTVTFIANKIYRRKQVVL